MHSCEENSALNHRGAWNVWRHKSNSISTKNASKASKEGRSNQKNGETQQSWETRQKNAHSTRHPFAWDIERVPLTGPLPFRWDLLVAGKNVILQRFLII
eukprot:scaffold93867_cov35-Prasinocladus_malaysianus.AAC.1